MKQSEIKIGNSLIRRSAHACAFFNSKNEYYDVLTPFIKEGLDEGEMAFHILDAFDHKDHFERLAESGIQVEEAMNSNQLIVKDWSESYLKPGYFNQEDMLNLLESILKESEAKGCYKARLVGDMDWACKHEVKGIKDIVEYESRLNFFLPKYEEVVVVCTYDLNKHSATVIMDVLRTHPYVLIGGKMHANPYYVTPQEFLQELANRK